MYVGYAGYVKDDDLKFLSQRLWQKRGCVARAAFLHWRYKIHIICIIYPDTTAPINPKPQCYRLAMALPNLVLLTRPSRPHIQCQFHQLIHPFIVYSYSTPFPPNEPKNTTALNLSPNPHSPSSGGRQSTARTAPGAARA